jgi:hypothetical protein
MLEILRLDRQSIELMVHKLSAVVSKRGLIGAAILSLLFLYFFHKNAYTIGEQYGELEVVES